jgi:hypothetical protein
MQTLPKVCPGWVNGGHSELVVATANNVLLLRYSGRGNCDAANAPLRGVRRAYTPHEDDA